MGDSGEPCGILCSILNMFVMCVPIRSMAVHCVIKDLVHAQTFDGKPLSCKTQHVHAGLMLSKKPDMSNISRAAVTF